MRIRAFVVAAAVVLSACGGSDESTGSDPAPAQDSEGEAPDASSAPDDSDPSSSNTDLSSASFDPSLLSAAPVDPGLLLAVDGARTAAPGPIDELEAIVDQCSALPAATVTEIVSAADTLGLTYEFAASASSRASCRYTSDPHAIEVFVNRADALDRDVVEDLNFLGGEVTSQPSGGAELYFEDSFGAETFFAARAERDGWAVLVGNLGGTGMLESEEEYVGWANLALAALDGATALGAVDGFTAPPEDASASGARPCEVYSAEELSAVFGIALNEEPSPDGRPLCTWRSGDEAVVVSLLAYSPEEDLGFDGVPEAAGDGIYPAAFGNGSIVIDTPQRYQVSVTVRREAYGLERSEFGGVDERDTQPLVDALVANLVERTS